MQQEKAPIHRHPPFLKKFFPHSFTLLFGSLLSEELVIQAAILRL